MKNLYHIGKQELKVNIWKQESVDAVKCELILNLDKLHTTELGVERIKRNLSLDENDVVQVFREMIQSPNALITRKGKNWYVDINDCEITINARSYTIITAHKVKKRMLGAL